MTFYDPLTGQRRLSNLQAAPAIPGAGAQYLQSPAMMGGQTLGATPSSVYGAPRTMTHPSLAAATAGQPYGQQQFIPQVAPPVSSVYGTSPAAQYIAATQAASAHLGAGQPGAAGMTPQAGAAAYNPASAAPYGIQPQPGGMAAGAGIPAPPNVASPGQAHSYPGAGGPQYGYNYQDNDDHFPHRHRREKKKKSKTRQILEDLLAGTALAALAEKVDQHHEHARRMDRERREENRNEKAGTPNDPNVAPDVAAQRPPKGSALGFLHPQGHFVPAHLEAMIQHFVRGNKEQGLAPEGARSGYLHTGGHFVPMGMEGLIQEFKHTLVGDHEHRGRHRGSGSSEYSDSEYSDDSSGTEGRHRRRK